MRKRLLISALLLIGSTPALALDVSHYYLDLLVDPAAQHIEAMASLDLTVAEEDLIEGKFPLHFVGMSVEMVAVDGLIVEYEHTGGLLVVGLPEGMGPGSHQVEVNYYGTPEPDVTDWGSWGMVFEEDRVFTVNVIEGARHWFPCHDVLTDKASFEVRVTVPDTWEVAGPGKLLQVDLGDAVRSFHWLADWPLPTYLMHFAAAPYNVVEEEHEGIPYIYYLYPTSAAAALDTLQHAPQAIEMLTGLYGDYPYPKVSFNEINLGGAVEQPSSVSIGTQIFAAPEDFAEVVAHEMAHSWFQGMVTIASWQDLWLSEGLATYHEALYAGHLKGPEAEMSYAHSLALSYRTTASTSEGFFSVHNPEEMWGVTVYRKGALVFHMLRYLVGDEAFFALLNEYLASFGGGNASTADFQVVAEEVSGLDLQPFFDEWVFGKGYLQLEVAWQWDGESVSIYVKQAQPDDWGPYLSVPLPLRAVGPPDAALDIAMPLTGWVTQASFEAPFEPEELLVDPDGWLLLKSSEVDFPVFPVEAVEIVEPAMVADIASADAMEMMDLRSELQTIDIVEADSENPGGGGCDAGGHGTTSWILLLLLLYGLERLRQRGHRIA